MAPTLDRIVVGMDFSSAAREAAHWILEHLAPAGRILLVQGSDLTVMGSRGSGGLAGRLGSVARAVLRGVAGPVLIVHADRDGEETES
jgi:nucleotide-binding universal stress UspA family protein